MIEAKQEIFDCIVIGGGIAGLTAGLYLAYSCTKVLVFERELFGGKLNYIPTVENYAGFSSIKGKELSQKIYSQVSKFGITKYAYIL